MSESLFKTSLKNTLLKRFPGSMVIHLDPTDIQGVPDLLVLIGPYWFALEGKRSENASHRPNQQYYVDKMDSMSFARFIYPENMEEVLDEIERTLLERGVDNEI